MRAKSQWTPEGITLWLIAAILASLIVCSQARPETVDHAPGDQVELEVLAE